MLEFHARVVQGAMSVAFLIFLSALWMFVAAGASFPTPTAAPARKGRSAGARPSTRPRWSQHG
jgi:hypothetical protein